VATAAAIGKMVNQVLAACDATSSACRAWSTAAQKLAGEQAKAKTFQSAELLIFSVS